MHACLWSMSNFEQQKMQNRGRYSWHDITYETSIRKPTMKNKIPLQNKIFNMTNTYPSGPNYFDA